MKVLKKTNIFRPVRLFYFNSGLRKKILKKYKKGPIFSIFLTLRMRVRAMLMTSGPETCEKPIFLGPAKSS